MEPENFMKLFIKALEHLVLCKDLTGTDMRVFFALVSLAKSDNKICISQKELGEYLNIARTEVSRSIAKLGDFNYLTIVDRIGKQNVYMLNPDIVFSGDGKHRQAALIEYRNPMSLPKAVIKHLKNEIFPQSDPAEANFLLR